MRDHQHEMAIHMALEEWNCEYGDWKFEPSVEDVYLNLKAMENERIWFTPDYRPYDEEELREDAQLIWEWIQNGGMIRAP